MGGEPVSPSFLLLCSSKEYENEKHEEQWMCCLVWVTLSGCGMVDRGQIFLFSMPPAVVSVLEAEPFWSPVKLCYDPYKNYFYILWDFRWPCFRLNTCHPQKLQAMYSSVSQHRLSEAVLWTQIWHGFWKKSWYWNNVSYSEDRKDVVQLINVSKIIMLAVIT